MYVCLLSSLGTSQIWLKIDFFFFKNVFWWQAHCQAGNFLNCLTGVPQFHLYIIKADNNVSLSRGVKLIIFSSTE